MKTGKVFLVGAGPGDVGLITVKGLDAVKQAEVILYDRLANPKLLEYADSDCELIYCGKLPDRHTLRQENINGLLVQKALEGKLVVRLKGGDPGIFGRVGEEAAALAEFQIPFEIVPGISSGIAAPLYTGIPVTHREHAESFAVVTAHDKSQNGKPLLDWEGLARGVDTIAFYMGVGNLPFICENLIRYGKPSSTPVILIHWGTFGRQRTLQGTLADISEKVLQSKFSNPSIILVGDVISLREKISWFEKKPLYGRQILLARTSASPSVLAKELQAQGADVIEFPKWKVTKIPLDLTRVAAYEKILFTSPESAAEFFEALLEAEIDIRRIHAEFYGLSSKTIKALRERGVIGKLAQQIEDSENMLVIGENHLLQKNYQKAEMMVTSEKELDRQFLPIFQRMLKEAKINTMIFPSSASVEPFLTTLEDCQMNAAELLHQVQVIAMGELTQAAAIKAGLAETEKPVTPTKEALVDYMVKHPLQGVQE
ncbi:uroporphyrinogen-III C-methyltransferase [Neobacillus cucumis]|uniref:Uroporphyrinogen-III C-methyltransferase n=1 Tax=Neobacillus cucumis TaxID=1740721 RepID=A0A2N5HJI7_9BACI|nr:uroporphyrinogen-III C-methyltransferase [Neobacillus cucumis]PLS05664.1 uroporphyrinogen-III C-methyltransferase [Neobacillus cucumis]